MFHFSWHSFTKNVWNTITCTGGCSKSSSFRHMKLSKNVWNASTDGYSNYSTYRHLKLSKNVWNAGISGYCSSFRHMKLLQNVWNASTDGYNNYSNFRHTELPKNVWNAGTDWNSNCYTFCHMKLPKSFWNWVKLNTFYAIEFWTLQEPISFEFKKFTIYQRKGWRGQHAFLLSREMSNT